MQQYTQIVVLSDVEQEHKDTETMVKRALE